MASFFLDADQERVRVPRQSVLESGGMLEGM